MSPRSQVQKRNQKHRRSLMFSTGIANGSSEPGSKTRPVLRPETSTKLDLIDKCRKRELGAKLKYETRNETRNEIRDIHDQQRDQDHRRSSIRLTGVPNGSSEPSSKATPEKGTETCTKHEPGSKTTRKTRPETSLELDLIDVSQIGARSQVQK